MAYQLNSNYNPNDPLSNRYVPVVADSTPAVVLPKTTPAPAPSITIVGQDQNKPANSVPINLPIGSPIPKGATDIKPVSQPAPAPKPTFEPNPTPNQPAGKEFYRVGSALYDASTNKQISATDWKQNWTGRAKEIQKGYEAIPNPGAISQYEAHLQPAGSKTLYGIKKATSDQPGVGGSGTGQGANVNINGLNVDITDPNVKKILQYAGQADLPADQVVALLNQYSAPTADEKAKIEQGLGIPDVVKSLYTTPSKTSQDIYNEAYNSSDLPTLKTKIAEIDQKIADKKAQITQATADLQNNPWLSQASRGGRIRNLNETAQNELNNLLAERQQQAELYNTGVSEIEKVMVRYKDQLESDRTINANKLNYLLNQAEKQTTALAQDKQSKNLRYLPEYLKNKADKNLAKTAFDLTKQQLELQKLGLDIEKAKKDTGGLPTAVATRVDKIANQFDGEATVKNYAQAVEGWNLVSQISENTKNPAENQALIYAFAKAMDPTSVVREGEYATVQKYSQSWLESFGFNALRVANNSEFLTPEAITNIKSTIAKKLNGTQTAYQNLANEYARRIDRITGQADGIDYISNYSGGLMGGDNRTTLQMGTEAGYSAQEIKDAIQQKGESAVRQWLQGKKKTSSVSGSGARTDRHNNPTAFTTDIAKQAGLKEGVDYTVGDPFPGNPNYRTATILGDPIDTTIKVIDKIGFQTQSGAPRWTYINMPKSQWNAMSYDQKKQTIAKMYQNEGGSALKQYFA